MSSYNKMVLSAGVKKIEEQINQELAKKAGLVNAGRDNEGSDLYLGTQKEWDEYEKLEKGKLVDIADEDLNEKLEGEYQDEMRDSLD